MVGQLVNYIHVANGRCLVPFQMDKGCRPARLRPTWLTPGTYIFDSFGAYREWLDAPPGVGDEPTWRALLVEDGYTWRPLYADGTAGTRNRHEMSGRIE